MPPVAKQSVRRNETCHEQLIGHSEAERLSDLEIGHQLILGRGLHQEVGWFLALVDAIDVSRLGIMSIGRHSRLGCRCLNLGQDLIERLGRHPKVAAERVAESDNQHEHQRSRNRQGGRHCQMHR
jgi:hypothetical protein